MCGRLGKDFLVGSRIKTGVFQCVRRSTSIDIARQDDLVSVTGWGVMSYVCGMAFHSTKSA